MYKHSKRNVLRIFVSALFLIAICGVCINANAQRATGIWRVRIKNFSTRFMESDGFLQFKFDWNWDKGAIKDIHSRTKTCLCLNSSGSDEGMDPFARPVECREPTEEEVSCLAIIKTNKSGSTFSIGPFQNTRYYIAEKTAEDLKYVLKNEKHVYRMEIASGNDFSVAIGTLYIDDMPVDEYLKRLR